MDSISFLLSGFDISYKNLGRASRKLNRILSSQFKQIDTINGCSIYYGQDEFKDTTVVVSTLPECSKDVGISVYSKNTVYPMLDYFGEKLIPRVYVRK